MEEIAYCGLDCTECPVFIATVNNDDALRLKTAKEWSKLYADQLSNKELLLEDMDCSGCKSKSGALFVGCKICPIKKCCEEKKYSHCAGCNEYDTCEMINGFFTCNQQAKQNLDKIREMH